MRLRRYRYQAVGSEGVVVAIQPPVEGVGFERLNAGVVVKRNLVLVRDFARLDL